MSARPGAERCCGSRLVEGARLRNPPVEQQRLLLLVAQSDPTDVVQHRLGTVRLHLQSAEGETFVDLTQLQHPVLVDAREGIPL